MTDDPTSTARPAGWDATTYHRVSDPHVRWGQPIIDLLDLRGDETLLDAGCGTGRLTAQVLERLPRGRVIAVDRDAAMLAGARDHLGADHRVRYVQADLLDLDAAVAEPVDRVFSTATFHWVPDHDRLFEALFRALRPGGWLVAQCGGAGNLDRLLGHVAAMSATDPWAAHLGSWPGPWHFSDAEAAAGRLGAAGFTDIETGLIEAPVPQADEEAFAGFARTVIFGEHLRRLPADLHGRFIAEVTTRAATDDPPLVLDYVRLNIRARRPE